MNDLLLILLCSAWGIILAEEIEPLEKIKTILINRYFEGKDQNKLNPFQQITSWFFMAITCSKCLSYHLFWISYLLIYHSFYGLLIGVASYFLTVVFRRMVPK